MSLPFLQTTAYASDIVFKMPYKTHIHVLNDEKVDISQKLTDTSPFIFLKVHNGVNQVVFNYECYYRENGDDIFFSSNELIATFKIDKRGIYQLNLPRLNAPPT
ncbi:DUF2057 family protein [Photobacterium damselae]|uniref:DUF2057 family protein n=1 Tax=Photobacterium damselae TaxID=38293 RepID=UPI001F33690E|nr:DUF2057 family protein [Photobacterium damselae]UKA04654.1 DUF2057 family protein [Photobacterium damselae subsp. damselae]